MPRLKPSKRNVYTSSRRNIKLEKKMHKVAEPKPFLTGLGSKTPKGPTTAILVFPMPDKDGYTGHAQKIKGPLKTYKKNVAKSAVKLGRRVNKANPLPDSTNMRRVRNEGLLTRKKKSVAKSSFSPRKVSGKARPVRSVGRGGGGAGGGGLGRIMGQIK